MSAQITRAIAHLKSVEDLKAIRQAAEKRLTALWEHAQRAKHEAAFRKVQAYPVGATLFVHGERDVLYLGAHPKRSLAVRKGERFIVYRFMPRARVVCVERPDEPEWNGWLLRLYGRDLLTLDLRPDPPAAASVPLARSAAPVVASPESAPAPF